ncbi:MAG TPA: GNAT family N-acetyltransferase [Ferruginibacter sp.]|jgi:hypothetical protein|nr:GNAT family N-acetyltransferase [Ferruginibacter sp.]
MKKEKVINLVNTLTTPIPVYPIVWGKLKQTFPDHGQAGISFHKNVFSERFLYRNNAGKLIGVAEYFSADRIEGVTKGDINICVDPDEMGKGIGTKLIKEVTKGKDINFEQQKCSAFGYKLVRSYLKGKGYKYHEDENVEQQLKVLLELSPTWGYTKESREYMLRHLGTELQ